MSSSHQQTLALHNLNTLPTELLLMIAEHLEDSSLKNLCGASKRLRCLALTVFKARSMETVRQDLDKLQLLHQIDLSSNSGAILQCYQEILKQLDFAGLLPEDPLAHQQLKENISSIVSAALATGNLPSDRTTETNIRLSQWIDEDKISWERIEDVLNQIQLDIVASVLEQVLLATKNQYQACGLAMKKAAGLGQTQLIHALIKAGIVSAFHLRIASMEAFKQGYLTQAISCINIQRV
jgi:hypothetical protein